MFVYIKIIGGDHRTEGKSVKININQDDLIATLKDIYVNTGLCPTPTSISLRFNGKILLDEQSIGECEIPDGAVIYHFTYNMVSYSSQDYNELSSQLRKKSRKSGEFFQTGHKEDNVIWESKLENILETKNEKALIKPESPPPFKPQKPGRILVRTYICNVGGFRFESYQKMEGRWNGTISVLGNNLTDQGSVCNVNEIFDPKGFWIERRSITYPNGVSTIQEIKFTPISSGVLKGEILTDHKYLNNYITLKELENDIFILSYFSKLTKLPLMVETITLIDDYSRVRTQQQFDGKGNLLRVYIMNEQRVIDEVSGAVTKVAGFDFE